MLTRLVAIVDCEDMQDVGSGAVADNLALLLHEVTTDDGPHVFRGFLTVTEASPWPIREAVGALMPQLIEVQHERHVIPATKPNVPTFEEWQRTRRFVPDLRKEDQSVFGEWCESTYPEGSPMIGKPIPALVYDDTRVIEIVTPDWPEAVRSKALYNVLITNYEVSSMDLEECERELYAFDYPTDAPVEEIADGRDFTPPYEP